MTTLQSTHHRVSIDVSSYYDQLFCLKRENLPTPQAIRVISTSKGEKARVKEILLFSPTSETYVLQLNNENAMEGVKFLWQQLGCANEVLFRIIDVDPTESHYTDLRRQFEKIEIDDATVLMNRNEKLRSINEWNQARKVHNQVTVSSMLSKRKKAATNSSDPDTKSTKQGKTAHPLSKAYKDTVQKHFDVGGTRLTWVRRLQLIGAAAPNNRQEGKILKDYIKRGDETSVVEHLRYHPSEEFWMNSTTDHETLKMELEQGMKLARRYNIKYHLINGKPHEKLKYIKKLVTKIQQKKNQKNKNEDKNVV